MEDFLKFEIKSKLPENFLEKMLSEFDKRFQPIDGTLESPSNLKITYSGEIYLSGKKENHSQNAEIIKYPSEKKLNYLETKGQNATNLILEILNEYKINYSTPMTESLNK